MLTSLPGGRPAAPSGYRRGASASGQPMSATPGIIEFETPSRNISCGLTAAAVLCDVRHYSYASIPRPTTCRLNWGAGWISLDAHRVTRGACLGGPPFAPVSRVLPYGSSLRWGAFSCRSESALLTCADVGTGRGFTVNRTTVRTY